MLTRCTPLHFCSAAPSCASLVRCQQRLSVHPRLRRISVVAAAGRAADEDPNSSPVSRLHRNNTTAAQHVGVQAFLEGALGISEAAALDLISRGSRGACSFLRLADCQAWVVYLTQLAGGHTATVSAILHSQPRVLSCLYDEQRAAKLQRHLQQRLSIEPSQLLLMVTRRPQLLRAAPDTVEAATHFLLTHYSGDTAALRKAVVSHPGLLVCSLSKLHATLQWLTGPLGAPVAVALRMLPQLASVSVVGTLEPGRQWFLRQGLTPAQVLSLTQGAPALLYRDMDGQLIQLKLRFWREQLGYHLTDLTLIPVFLTCSLTRIAGIHSALCHLHDATPSHRRFLSSLIAGSGPELYASFVKQHSDGSGSVQEVLLPLSASLGQPALRAEWKAELMSNPSLSAAGASARRHGALYAALHSIQQRDWVLSDAGLGWLADEAAAKAADLAARAGERAAARLAKQPPQWSRRKGNNAAPEQDTL